MYSIKPGRSQSLFGAFAGVIFIIVLMVMMGGMKGAGAPSGLLVIPILMAVLVFGSIILGVYNAFAANRTSDLDITTPGEEFDPMDLAARRRRSLRARGRLDRSRPTASLDRTDTAPGFCTKCGLRLDAGDNYCGHCGMAVEG